MKRQEKTGPKDKLNPFPGTAIRVNEDGSQERVPFLQFKIGDVVLDEDSGKKMRIITERKLLGALATGRFQFANPGDKHWYAAMTHGSETLYYIVDPPTSPFGKGESKHLDVGWQNAEVDALTFEEIVDEPVSA